MDPFAAAVIWSLLPTVVVSVVFYFVIRSVLRMDRTERKAHAKIEAQERAKRGLGPVPARAPGADR
jgi:preprotein translocase subunit YajC